MRELEEPALRMEQACRMLSYITGGLIEFEGIAL